MSLIQKYTGKKISYKDSLTLAMKSIMDDNPHAVIMGQGVADHKGTFGTTLGFQNEYGKDRVIDTPLCEEAMTGLGVGYALGGVYPIQTHIRADFALLAMNQIINLAAKYRYMSGGHYEIPMMIRLVVGRSWGQGAQHSQSIQSLLAHIPGLHVLMPSHPNSILRDYPLAAKSFKNPIICIEHRLMYDLEFIVDEDHAKEESFQGNIVREGSDVTIVSTSIMSLEAKRAADFAQKELGISCEIIDLNCVSDICEQIILESVKKTGKLIVADTSWIPYGVCAEIPRIICESNPEMLKAPVQYLGMAHAPCPTAKSLEDLYYPNITEMVKKIIKLCPQKGHPRRLPTEKSMTECYKHFRGPF